MKKTACKYYTRPRKLGYEMQVCIIIRSHYYDGLKFACIDFSLQQQKKEGALHTDRPVFEFPNHTAEFPDQPTCMIEIDIE